jgi:signal transduction histidine kinase
MERDRRVLVVDPMGDETGATLERSLSVTTVAAVDPDRARTTLDDRRVDCVVTELRFDSEGVGTEGSSSGNGGLAGTGLLDSLRERDPTLPIVVYTDADLASLDAAALVEWVERCVAARTGHRDRLAGVVHDLRNPLRAANVSLARLRQDADLDADQVADLAATHERLGDLLDDLDALVDAGRPVADTESVALDAVARETWRTVDTRGATLRVETGASVDADRRKLRRLFENLFANAVEHGSTDGDPATDEAPATDLTVTVGDAADGFFVADDGPGIPERDQEVVFERGYSTVDGTGYGLAIVAELAAAHGWSASAAESDSGGARIEVRT